MKIRTSPITTTEREFKSGDIIVSKSLSTNICILLSQVDTGIFKYAQFYGHGAGTVTTGKAPFTTDIWKLFRGELILSNDKE